MDGADKRPRAPSKKVVGIWMGELDSGELGWDRERGRGERGSAAPDIYQVAVHGAASQAAAAAPTGINMQIDTNGAYQFWPLSKHGFLSGQVETGNTR